MGTQTTCSSPNHAFKEGKTVAHLLFCVVTENVGFSTVHFVVTVVSQLDGEIQTTHDKSVCKKGVVHSTP